MLPAEQHVVGLVEPEPYFGPAHAEPWLGFAAASDLGFEVVGWVVGVSWAVEQEPGFVAVGLVQTVVAAVEAVEAVEAVAAAAVVAVVELVVGWVEELVMPGPDGSLLLKGVEGGLAEVGLLSAGLGFQLDYDCSIATEHVALQWPVVASAVAVAADDVQPGPGPWPLPVAGRLAAGSAIAVAAPFEGVGGCLQRAVPFGQLLTPAFVGGSCLPWDFESPCPCRLAAGQALPDAVGGA